jgi:shikimate dehydrogenase
VAEWFAKSRALPYFCVVGSPIAHSKSPAIHSAFASQCGFELIYEKVEVAPGRLRAAVAEFRAVGGRGLNVTLPLKEEACALADIRMPRAARAGAANTLWFDARGVVADNTDGLGLVRDLEINHGQLLRGKRILLIGAGGAARGVLPALLDADPACIIITNRTIDRASALMDSHLAPGRVQVLPWGGKTGQPCEIIINATSLSLHGEIPLLAASVVSAETLCYDMMYGPSPTSFMNWAAAAGALRVVDGLGMLVEQAAAAFSIWNGLEPKTAPVIAMTRAQLAGGV